MPNDTRSKAIEVMEIFRDIVNKTVDDKTIIIWSVTIIVICAIFKVTEPKEVASIIQSALSGLFGIAVGRAWGKQESAPMVYSTQRLPPYIPPPKQEEPQ